MASESQRTVSPAAYEHAAWMLDCDVPAIRAVAEVEAGTYGAFLPTGEPIILYEPHIFSRLTAGKFDGRRAANLPAAYNELSYPKWKTGAYGPMSAQHARLQAAAMLDRSSALQACSWGLFQVLGSNYRRTGHVSLQSFVTAAYESADAHVRMFVHFILGDIALHQSLRAHEWTTFARIYNGPGFTANKYDTRMADAYERLRGK